MIMGDVGLDSSFLGSKFFNRLRKHYFEAVVIVHVMDG